MFDRSVEIVGGSSVLSCGFRAAGVRPKRRTLRILSSVVQQIFGVLIDL